jgi:hypothetical protein
MEERETAAIEEVRARVIEYSRRNELQTGHHLSRTQVHQIALSLNPHGKNLLNAALQAVIDEGVFKRSRGETGEELELTGAGFQELYSGSVRKNGEGG